MVVQSGGGHSSPASSSLDISVWSGWPTDRQTNCGDVKYVKPALVHIRYFHFTCAVVSLASMTKNKAIKDDVFDLLHICFSGCINIRFILLLSVVYSISLLPAYPVYCLHLCYTLTPETEV